MIEFKHTNTEMKSAIKPRRVFDGLVDPASIECVYEAPFDDGDYWLKTKTGRQFSLTRQSYEKFVELLNSNA